MSTQTFSAANPNAWSCTCHLDYGDHGKLINIHFDGNSATLRHYESSAATGADHNQKVVFIGQSSNHLLLLNPETNKISTSHTLPADARAAYSYRDPESNRIWFMNDGDKSGNDGLSCPQGGASVSVISTNDDGSAEHLNTICVGRGHHVTTFTAPSVAAPNTPHRAFVSNLKDGTISVIGNDPNDAVTFLKVITTLNLYDPSHEDEGSDSLPNNAFPHGMEYSPQTGKLYCLNNGYNSVAVIDPLTHEIEARFAMPVSSNLLLSRCGLFLIGKGADRKANPDHVIGRLCVMDAVTGEIITRQELPDLYPSTYRFNPNGDRLYVTTAVTGKGLQRDNLKSNIAQVYDSSALPALTLLREIAIEASESGRCPIAFVQPQEGDKRHYVLLSNPSQGTLTLLNGSDDSTIEQLTLGAEDIKEFSFSFWNNRRLYGA